MILLLQVQLMHAAARTSNEHRLALWTLLQQQICSHTPGVQRSGSTTRDSSWEKLLEDYPEKHRRAAVVVLVCAARERISERVATG